MQIYDIIKDVKNDKWAVRRISDKKVLEKFSTYAQASRVCDAMNNDSQTTTNKETD